MPLNKEIKAETYSVLANVQDCDIVVIEFLLPIKQFEVLINICSIMSTQFHDPWWQPKVWSKALGQKIWDSISYTWIPTLEK